MLCKWRIPKNLLNLDRRNSEIQESTVSPKFVDQMSKDMFKPPCIKADQVT